MTPKYETVSLEIPAGNNEATTKEISVNPSLQNHLVSAHSSQDEDISVSIDYQGNTIVPFIPLTFYDGKQGRFDERALELDFNERRNLKVNAKSSENVAQSTIITLVFKRYEE